MLEQVVHNEQDPHRDAVLVGQHAVVVELGQTAQKAYSQQHVPHEQEPAQGGLPGLLNIADVAADQDGLDVVHITADLEADQTVVIDQ